LSFDEDFLLSLVLPTPNAFETANSEPTINPFFRSDDDELLFFFNSSSLRIWRLRFQVFSDKRESSLDEDDGDDEV
jgi:hypothetical protein